MKGLQGSSFLISSHPINTVPGSPHCLTFFLWFVFSSTLSLVILVCSCVTDDDYYEDDEEDDPDALKDPIYQIDLQVH